MALFKIFKQKETQNNSFMIPFRISICVPMIISTLITEQAVVGQSEKGPQKRNESGCFNNQSDSDVEKWLFESPRHW